MLTVVIVIVSLISIVFGYWIGKSEGPKKPVENLDEAFAAQEKVVEQAHNYWWSLCELSNGTKGSLRERITAEEAENAAWDVYYKEDKKLEKIKKKYKEGM